MARYDFQSSLGSGQTKIEDVVVGEDFTSLLTQVIGTITRVSDAWSRGDVFNSSGIIDTLEASLANTVPVASPQRVFIDMCREAIDNADIKGGVDPIITAKLFTTVMTRVLRENASGISHVHSLQRLMNEVLTCRKHLRNVSKRCHKDNIIQFLSTIDVKYGNMIHEALQLAGAEGRISLQTSAARSATSTISVQDDYIFDIVSPCMSVIDNTDTTFELPRALIVDGFIDSVAEVDHILSAAAEDKQSLVIFARKFDPEVLTTVAYNNRRGTFKVLPIIVPYDADSANVLKDLAVICNSTVISSLLGQLVTSTSFHELPVVDCIKVGHDMIHIQNEYTVEHVRAHVESLHGMLQRDDNGISHNFINKRIRCMSNRLINVRISEVNNRSILTVDRCIRRVNSALKRGVVVHDDLKLQDVRLSKELSDILSRNIIFSMDEIDQLLLCVGGLVRLLGMSNCLVMT